MGLLEANLHEEMKILKSNLPLKKNIQFAKTWTKTKELIIMVIIMRVGFGKWYH